MKVAVVVEGCYSDQGIQGVYASSAAAIAALPVDESKVADSAWSRPGGWQGSDEDGWWNGLDYYYSLRIEMFDLEGLETLDPQEVVHAIAAVHARDRA